MKVIREEDWEEVCFGAAEPGGIDVAAWADDFGIPADELRRAVESDWANLAKFEPEPEADFEDAWFPCGNGYERFGYRDAIGRAWFCDDPRTAVFRPVEEGKKGK